jgi:hypothetical protein
VVGEHHLFGTGHADGASRQFDVDVFAPRHSER